MLGYHLPLHLATATDVQMATPVPKIVDTSSYLWEDGEHLQYPI
jgi:hypothetical protein